MSVLFFVAISLVFFYGSVRYAIYLAAAAVFYSLLFSHFISEIFALLLLFFDLCENFFGVRWFFRSLSL